MGPKQRKVRTKLFPTYGGQLVVMPSDKPKDHFCAECEEMKTRAEFNVAQQQCWECLGYQ